MRSIAACQHVWHRPHHRVPMFQYHLRCLVHASSSRDDQGVEVMCCDSGVRLTNFPRLHLHQQIGRFFGRRECTLRLPELPDLDPVAHGFSKCLKAEMTVISNSDAWSMAAEPVTRRSVLRRVAKFCSCFQTMHSCLASISAPFLSRQSSSEGNAERRIESVQCELSRGHSWAWRGL